MVRRIPLLVALAALALPGHALAAPPAVTAQATPANGAAPLAVTLTATGDATAYHWDLGDGASADGAVVEHSYAAGAWTATVTATGADGETAQASVQVTATGVTLRAPKVVAYGKPALFRGRVLPAAAGTRVTIVAGSRTVTHATTKGDGSFRVRTRVRFPGPYEARAMGAVSAGVPLLVRPLVSASLAGAGLVGQPLTLRARLSPSAAGSVRVRIWRNGRETLDRTARAAAIHLGTGAAASFRVRVDAVPCGIRPRGRELLTVVHSPTLSLGSRGPSVLALEQRLRELHYALSTVDGYFGYDTLEAVYAFQKVYGLPRTGRSTSWSGGGSRPQRCRRPATAATTSRSTRRARCCSSSTRPGGARDYGLDGRHREHAARPLPRLQQGAGLQRQAHVLLVLLHRRLRDPRLLERPALPGEPRVRPGADLGRGAAVRAGLVRLRGRRLPLGCSPPRRRSWSC